MSFWHVVLGLHIGGGFVALLSMWVPLFSAKGGTVHRKAGAAFVAAMAIVAATSIVLATRIVAVGPVLQPVANATRTQEVAAGVFLFYVGLLTAASTWKGVRVLRTKTRTGPSRHPADLALPASVLAAGLAMLTAAVVTPSGLLAGFGLLGVVSGASDLRYWLRPPQERMHWWMEHMADMIGTCIAAITAFAVLNAQRLGLPPGSLVAWLGPSLVGVPVLALWTRRYRARFAAAGTPERNAA